MKTFLITSSIIVLSFFTLALKSSQAYYFAGNCPYSYNDYSYRDYGQNIQYGRYEPELSYQHDNYSRDYYGRNMSYRSSYSRERYNDYSYNRNYNQDYGYNMSF